MTEPVRTTCPYCGVGCGLLVSAGADGMASVVGDPEHPANLGRLCSKGAALGETLDLQGRLLHPRIDGERVGWDRALDHVAGRLCAIVAEHGPDSVAFYVSGQLLTEDYYVANKLMKGFVGSANIDTNSRLCMASSVAGYKRALGSDTVPCDYLDLEESDLIVLVGSNTAWCHPVIYQRIKKAKQARPGLQVVAVDPRRTATCEIADLHLALAPGSDAVLYNGLLNWLRREDALDWGFLERHTEGFADAFAAARDSAGSIPAVARACGLAEEAVADFYRRFARTERTVTLYSQGVNQWSFGTDKVNAIINCHLATGRIGRPGMGPFSITGQPNAMGGREVGGLANQLAAHMDFDPESLERVGRFWKAERLAAAPGLKAGDLLRAVEDGRVKAIWVMATNPVVSMPDAERVKAALAACELVVCSDLFADTDTARLAHCLLPASGWGEKDGTVTNSERRISRQRAFLQAPGEARPDWWILTQVARRMGFAAAFPYASAAEIFREHAALSGLGNGGTRGFDIGALASLSDAQYAGLAPTQWPMPADRAATRPFADRRFHTQSGRARLIPIRPRSPATPTDADFPLALNTGRVRDQWHTMTRTGRTARLTAHCPEPFVQVHPADGVAFGLKDGAIARLESAWGQMLARVRVDGDQRQGSLFVPMHWGEMLARSARANALVNPAFDPISGQPELKHTAVRAGPFPALWHGLVLSRERIEPGGCDYRVAVRGDGHWRSEIAGLTQVEDWGDWARRTLGTEGEWLEFADPARGSYRGARILEGRLVACLFVSQGPGLPRSAWLEAQLRADTLGPAERAALLAGRPPKGQRDPGETVCACFKVGRSSIVAAIREAIGEPGRESGREAGRGGVSASLDAIAVQTCAGTGCGSCLPELRRIVETESALRT